MAYLLQVAKDKSLVMRVPSNRRALRARGLYSVTISRNLTSIRATLNFMCKEQGLQPNKKFSSAYFGEPTVKQKPYMPTLAYLKLLEAHYRKTDDQQRWLITLINDTALKLSESDNQCISNVA